MRHQQPQPEAAVLPFGLGMPDFNRPGRLRLYEAYLQKKKHIDAHLIGQMFPKHLQFPVTFDGSLPSETFGKGSGRILLGETYCFEDGKGVQVVGTVTAATVSEAESKLYCAMTDPNGQSNLYGRPMSPDELADHASNPDAYFGKIQSVGRKITDNFELFEWLMEANQGLGREALLERFANVPNFEELKAATDEELLAAHCESLVAALDARTSRNG